MACPKCETGAAGNQSHCHCISGACFAAIPFYPAQAGEDGSHVHEISIFHGHRKHAWADPAHSHDASTPCDAVGGASIPSSEGMNGERVEIPVTGWAPRPRFLAVFHQWHVQSRGFETVELKACDRVAAQYEASYLLRCRQGFYSVDFTLVELQGGECLPRRLSWLERLTGRLRRG